MGLLLVKVTTGVQEEVQGKTLLLYGGEWSCPQ